MLWAEGLGKGNWEDNGIMWIMINKKLTLYKKYRETYLRPK